MTLSEKGSFRLHISSWDHPGLSRWALRSVSDLLRGTQRRDTQREGHVETEERHTGAESGVMEPQAKESLEVLAARSKE